MADDTRTQLQGGDAPDETRLSPPAPAASTPTTGGWLSSSGSIDHGRFAPGTVVEGRYRVIGLLGRGGMGEVYRADDLRLGQPVALKFLPENFGRDQVRLAQFHNEVRTARQVSHPNVCRVYDIGDLAGHLFLTMEYVDGEDLASLLRRIGRLPEDKAVEIARQICAGLAAAHERGIIHRDLKPANIMLDGSGRVRIMDFSLAAVGSVTDVVAGTPAYMAPEQLAGKTVDARSDIYALGLVLYELFTGKRVFDAKTIPDLVAQHNSETIPSPTEIVKTLDTTIERVILRCLESNPARRPASPLAVSAGLPGGDPLAAALAAGETPSPEMVAAAGGESATLSPLAGAIWIGVAAVFLIAVAALADRTSLLARVPLEKPAPVLLDRAEEIRRSLGYTDTPVDRASAFRYATDYLVWGRRNGSGKNGWPELGLGRPAALLYLYRTSPVALIPLDALSIPDREDPPQTIAGMTQLVVDTRGRLLFFDAVPPQRDPTTPVTAFDWRVAFAAAGLDFQTFAETTPSRTPAAYADSRTAWKGQFPEQQTPITIEAASYRGLPTYFEVVGPWTQASREPGDLDDDDSRGAGGTVLILVLLVAAVILARRNIRSGRADRRGAFRIGAVLFFIYVVTWVFLPHLRSLPDDTTRLFVFLGLGLFVGGVMNLVYLAIEPFVRRIWPTMLVGWSRVLSGRLRDAVIGRDLIVGTACGLALTVLEQMNNVAPHLFGWQEPSPLTQSASLLEHGRYFVIQLSNSVNSGLQNALLNVMAFTIARDVIRRGLARLPFKIVSIDTMSVLITVAVVTLVRLADSSSTPPEIWLVAANLVTTMTVFLFVLVRFGLFATVVMSSVNVLTLRTPLTLEGDRLYTGTAWATLGVIVGIAVVGLWLARAGEPLFSSTPREQRG